MQYYLEMVARPRQPGEGRLGERGEKPCGPRGYLAQRNLAINLDTGLVKLLSVQYPPWDSGFQLEKIEPALIEMSLFTTAL